MKDGGEEIVYKIDERVPLAERETRRVKVIHLAPVAEFDADYVDGCVVFGHVSLH